MIPSAFLSQFSDLQAKLVSNDEVLKKQEKNLAMQGELATAAQELTAVQRLQLTFIKNGLNYTLQANAIVAPDGKSWAWEIGPSEEQSPNLIYALYYYPATHEIHSIHLDNAKAAAKLEKATKDAGMQLKWVKDMNDR